MRKLRWWLHNPWELWVGLDMWLIAPYPVPRWRNTISHLINPLVRTAVLRWHPETLESPPGWSPKPWNKRDWDLHSS